MSINASNLRKQDIMFAILKQLAENDVPIFGDGVLEILQDGFGFLRSPGNRFQSKPSDIFVTPDTIRRHYLREGCFIKGPKNLPPLAGGPGSAESALQPCQANAY